MLLVKSEDEGIKQCVLEWLSILLILQGDLPNQSSNPICHAALVCSTQLSDSWSPPWAVTHQSSLFCGISPSMNTGVAISPPRRCYSPGLNPYSLSLLVSCMLQADSYHCITWGPQNKECSTTFRNNKL